MVTGTSTTLVRSAASRTCTSIQRRMSGSKTFRNAVRGCPENSRGNFRQSHRRFLTPIRYSRFWRSIRPPVDSKSKAVSPPGSAQARNRSAILRQLILKVRCFRGFEVDTSHFRSEFGFNSSGRGQSSSFPFDSFVMISRQVRSVCVAIGRGLRVDRNPSNIIRKMKCAEFGARKSAENGTRWPGHNILLLRSGSRRKRT